MLDAGGGSRGRGTRAFLLLAVFDGVVVRADGGANQFCNVVGYHNTFSHRNGMLKRDRSEAYRDSSAEFGWADGPFLTENGSSKEELLFIGVIKKKV